MSTDELSYAEQLALLQQEYCSELPDRLQEIEDAWSSYQSSGWEQEGLKQLHYYIHRIVGSAATFGFLQLSESTRSIEQILKKQVQPGTIPTKELQQKLSKQVSLLQQQAKKNTVDVELNSFIQKTAKNDSEQPLIYLLEDDQSYAKKLVLQLSTYSYEIQVFFNTQSILDATRKQAPDLYIIDIVLQNEQLGGSDFLKKIRTEEKLDAPVIIHSSRTDFEARLSAVHAGADAYMVKPLDVDLIVSKIDDLLERKLKRPYQILLVDDDVSLSRHYALVLGQAGMQVQIVNRPQDVIAVMQEILPDIILMDLYMPECSGVDLAKVIRQQQQFDSVPIIFLSTEGDIDRQLFAMRMGGDEFLTKPITDDHLLTAVMIRASRARLLTELTTQDSLTGLLNHARLKEQLVNVVSRAQRTSSSFGFVMIDIDHFKAVNDNYGHMIGDRVIKNMSQLLRKRLRKNDVIGRYGGEEFAVILDDCSREDAFTLINSIREDFASQVFHSKKDFNVTFSAGIAMYPDYINAEDLNQEADEALYRAKDSGRNRVM